MDKTNVGVGSTIFAVKPGDGSAREQAASCQKVLGGWANIANEYATKRYRSNLINWGMLAIPDSGRRSAVCQWRLSLYPGVYGKQWKKNGTASPLISGRRTDTVYPDAGELTDDEREIILKGCLINYYRNEGNIQ